MAYQYSIMYRRSEDHTNADVLSRFPVAGSTLATELRVNYFTYTNDLPTTAQQISVETQKDRVLSHVLNHDELEPYFHRKDELSIDQGCILWELRDVIPTKYRPHLLNDLHEEHQGILHMNGLARSYLWYPGIDSDIEKLVGSCKICLSYHKTPPTGPLIPWLEVFPTASTTSQRVIKILRNLFASFGTPHEVVSDNGPQFASREFAQFLKLNGINQKLTPPYHPASNRCIERCIQTLKQGLRKSPSISRSQQLANFLLMYRITPHSSRDRF